jgi:hypothetical protein
MTTHEDSDIMICAICDGEADGEEYFTVRQAWLDAGGFGSIPDEAIVHVRYGDREQACPKGAHP